MQVYQCSVPVQSEIDYEIFAAQKLIRCEVFLPLLLRRTHRQTLRAWFADGLPLAKCGMF